MAVSDKHLDLRILEQFLVVADTSSMTLAAEKLDMSVPAVSQMVLRLERDLDIHLFERTNHGVRLTPAGALLRERARELLDSESDLVVALKAYRDRLVPRLRLQVVSSVANFVMPPIISQLSAYVGELELKSGQGPASIRDFLRGDLDVLIGTESMAEIPGIEQQLLCEEDLIGIVPSSVPPSERSLERLVELLPLVRFARGRGLHRAVQSYLGGRNIDPPHAIECSSPAPILEIVGEGAGWTIATPLTLGFLKPSPDKIAWMRLPNTVLARKIYLAAHTGKLLDLPQRLTERCRGALTRALGEWGTHDGGDILIESVRVAGVASGEPGRPRREMMPANTRRGVVKERRVLAEQHRYKA